jgi:dTDP-4-dehydrorhamnose reductase
VSFAGVEVEVHPTATTIAPGSARRPLNGVLAQDRAASLGLTPLPDWRDALEEFMVAAGLTVPDASTAST